MLSSTLTSTLYVALVTVSTLEMVLILILLRNRRRYKLTRRLLEQSHANLERRVQERTESLKGANKRLREESSKNRATSELLRESREYISSIINSLPSIVIGVTPQGMVTHWNSAAERATGLTAKQALGQSVTQVFPELPLSDGVIREAIANHTAKVYEAVQQGKPPEVSYLDISVFPLVSSKLSGAVIRVEDVTLRIRLENMMIQNEKMMSLGELAAGTAHEINNPLGAIVQNTQNLKRRLSSDLVANLKAAEAAGTTLEHINDYLQRRQIHQFIDAIDEAGRRATAIVSNMLEFSRSNNRSHQAINLRELIEHTIQLVHNTASPENGLSFADLAIQVDVAADMPSVLCAGVEIQQVLINLLRNAFQALAEWPERPEQPGIQIGLHHDGNYALLTVADNGPGIPEVIQRHIFEPFFTTKEVGKGTGLGLSVSYFIITEHHEGTIEVESHPGQGTCFTIRLPLV